MARSTSTKTATSFVVALLMLIALAAFAAVSAGGAKTPADQPDATPYVPTPYVSPTPKPDATPYVPAPFPTETPDGFVVDLDTADQHDVVVIVDDADGLITDARSGRAGDGMSVRWGDVVVENVDEDTLRITFAGYPQDEIIEVAVTAAGDGLSLTVTQQLPLPNTDAMGADRVLIIDVAEAVAAEDVSAEFVPGA